MTKSEMTKIFRMISGAFATFRPSEDSLDIWLRVLGDCPFEAVQAQLVSYLRQGGEKAPLPGQLRTKRLVGDSSTIRSTSQERSKERTEMISLGFVFVKLDDGLHTWDRKEFCIWDTALNAYRRKVDFCMDKWGATAVTNAIKEITQGQTLTSLVSNFDWVIAYRAKIDELTEEAQKVEVEK
jgi:hypothetical protein